MYNAMIVQIERTPVVVLVVVHLTFCVPVYPNCLEPNRSANEYEG